MKPIITLLSDFGASDAYVGAMKGVIYSICPDATIADISHQIPKFNIKYGAFLLKQVAPYFPEGTVHVAIVDPGVGTERKPIVIEGNRHFFVGPDNGILSLAAVDDGIKRVIEIKNKRYVLPKLSRTFAGRDVFAPVAAHIAKGVDVADVGPELERFKVLRVSKPVAKGGEVLGEVLHIDGFGNLITNIPEQALQTASIKEGEAVLLEAGGKVESVKLCRAYAEAPTGSPLIIIGSAGLLEVSVNQGSAAAFFRVEVGSSIRIKR